ncbi:cyclic nucleotide-binding domain-containing protein [Ilumatobacter nonamiensis]|uniref:cyclic nucleotide-binding domain-containing protein n=1 Tax=Ilumatobacter nonamiensis TaxID=467093 RepID=UPI00034A8E8F|nr:cyclic nucleotide-binding domain-containing protein [Ilumatobacter nonamiensis]
MARHDYHQYLKAVPLFANVDDDDLDVIGAAVTELSFDGGEVLMRAGSSAREMVIVLEGQLSVLFGDTEIATIDAGGFAGEMGLLAGMPRNATVTAKVPTRLLHIDSRSFDNVLNEAPQIAVAMLPIVAKRVVTNNALASD